MTDLDKVQGLSKLWPVTSEWNVAMMKEDVAEGGTYKLIINKTNNSINRGSPQSKVCDDFTKKILKNDYKRIVQ